MPSNQSSSSKNDRREAARLQAQRLREVQAKREKRNRLVLVAVAVAVVALIAVAAFVISKQANRTLLSDLGGPAPQGSDVNGGIPVGETGAAGTTTDGAVTVDLYLDFMCPYCGQLEQTNGGDLQTLITDGTATIVYHPVANLDQLSQGTNFSTRSANALATVANDAPESIMEFLAAMFANQPGENTEGLTDDEISQIAVTAGVPQEVADTFAAGTYNEWVDLATQQAQRDGATGTPTVMFDGEIVKVDWSTPGVLLAAVQAAAK